MGCTPSKQNNHVDTAASSPPETSSKGSKKEEEKTNKEFTKALSTSVSKSQTNCANDFVNEALQHETEDNTPRQSKDAPRPDPRRQILKFFSTIGSDKGPGTGKDSNKTILCQKIAATMT
jgi:hypothetical protein